MDFHLKQWRNQQESEQQPSAKIPKLLLDPHPQQPYGSGSALPLFVPEPNTKISNLSAFPDLPTTATRFPRMGGFFSLAQWQELELQALIFRYMIAGAAVPAELLHPIKKSLLINNPSYYLHHPLQHYPHYQPAALSQSGYWGRAVMDPEPGRCRRTDGKKWRCSRDVVAGQKYCERHVHRGRNRSRKPVEIPTATIAVTVAGGGGGGIIKSASPIAAPPLTAVAVPGGTHFALSGLSPSNDLLHLNQSSSESMNEKQGNFEAQSQSEKNISGNGRSDGRILRHFFDDWPRSLEESENGGSNGRHMTASSAGGLSISIAGNSPSDVSLKLSTGDEDDEGNGGRERGQLNWGGGGWGTHHVAPMGGPLAEALRSSSASNSSPTSVLHDLPRRSASDTSYVTT